MHPNYWKEFRTFITLLALMVSLPGARAASARAGALASVDPAFQALSAVITTITRVSVDSSGMEGNSYSDLSSISGDGRYVAFESYASNLVSGDTNDAEDIFLRDTQTSITTRQSVDSNGLQGNGYSSWPSISADGRFIAYSSGADNLVSGDTNNTNDIFLRDTQLGTTTRLSVNSSGAQGNDISSTPSISADGRYVAFQSAASNLVNGDTNGVDDIFLRDTQSGITTRLSVDSNGVQGNGYSTFPSISADGLFVAFSSSADNLVNGVTNQNAQIFRRDIQLGTIVLVSVSSNGTEGNHSPYGPASISGDGRYVAFQSSASNLVNNDTNGAEDYFRHDMQTGETIRVSVSSNGVEGNNRYGPYDPVLISTEGRTVVFTSSATNLVSWDVNDMEDIFMHDCLTGITARLAMDQNGTQSNTISWPGSISADGRYVSFQSWADNLVTGDTNETIDVFVVPVTLFRLTINKTGSGSGTITNTSSPASISCDAVCEYGFTSGTTLNLSTEPDPGSHFTGWDGEGCGGAEDCTVIMDSDKYITARFDLDNPRIYLPLVIR